MKLSPHFITGILSLFLLTSGFSQTCVPGRYLLPIFANTDKTSNIVFGTVPSVTNPYVAENITYSVDLEMDIFEPSGDTLNLRPAVILTFGGGYLLGGKDDEDIQLACDSLARRGFVTASIQYRLGMNIMNTSSAERAVYRGVQDMSAAVRYLKEYRSIYRIDTNFIFIGGVSAGAINALHLAFAEESDRPASTYASGGLFPAPDLGCANCSGNNYNHNGSNVKAVINCWGAIGDLGWIDPGEDIPIASFHGDADLIVPYDSGYPFSALATMPYVYGSNSITTRANTVGLYNEMNTFPGEGHNIWGTVANNNFIVGPTQYFGPIIRSISDFLFTFLKPPPISVTGTDELCQGDTATYSTPATGGSMYCWSIIGGTIISSNPYASNVDVVWDIAGTHDVQVVEQNYFMASGDTVDFSVQVNPLPVVDAGTDQEICYGDSVSINGSGALFYEWIPDSIVLNSQSPSTHAFPSQTMEITLIGMDTNGCINKDTMVIQVNPLPVVDAGTDQEICYGDSVSINGSGALLYEWIPDSIVLNSQSPSTIAFPSQTAQLTLTGSNIYGCMNEDMMVIQVNPLPVVDAGTDQEICYGDSVSINGSGALFYEWIPDSIVLNSQSPSTIAFPSQTAQLTLVGTDSNGCFNTDTMTIQVYNLPMAPIIWETGDTLFADPGFAYQWFFNDTLLLGENQNFITNLQEGYYTVEITDSQGCSAISDGFTYTSQPLGIAPKEASPIMISPNPGQGIYQLSCRTSSKKVEWEEVMIYNYCGSSIRFDLISNGNNQTIDISGYQNGLYLFTIRVNNKSYCHKILKN